MWENEIPMTPKSKQLDNYSHFLKDTTSYYPFFIDHFLNFYVLIKLRFEIFFLFFFFSLFFFHLLQISKHNMFYYRVDQEWLVFNADVKLVFAISVDKSLILANVERRNSKKIFAVTYFNTYWLCWRWYPFMCSSKIIYFL